MQTISDTTLLDQLKVEDTASFELLYKFYFPSVAFYIKQNQGNNEDAQDIFQEAIIVLLQKIRQPDFVLTSSLKTYLYAVSKNLWLKRLRDNKLRIVDNDFSYTDYGSEAYTFELEQEKSKEEKVENWLQKITRNCQSILKALFFYEKPMEDLMEKMGWKNKHTATNQKYKCIQQIKNVKEGEAQ